MNFPSTTELVGHFMPNSFPSNLHRLDRPRRTSRQSRRVLKTPFLPKTLYLATSSRQLWARDFFSGLLLGVSVTHQRMVGSDPDGIFPPRCPVHHLPDVLGEHSLSGSGFLGQVFPLFSLFPSDTPKGEQGRPLTVARARRPQAPRPTTGKMPMVQVPASVPLLSTLSPWPLWPPRAACLC